MLACPSALLVASLALAPAATPPREEACVRKVAELPRRPRVDGELKDWAGATPLLSRPATGKSPGLTARAAVFGDTLYLGIDVIDEHPEAGPVLT